MSPEVVLLPAIVLILAQLFHALFPGRTTYLRRILLAAAGVVIAETAGTYLLPPGLLLGGAHLMWDLIFTTPLQVLGNRFLR